jgi:hypothetical protein
LKERKRVVDALRFTVTVNECIPYAYIMGDACSPGFVEKIMRDVK